MRSFKGLRRKRLSSSTSLAAEALICSTHRRRVEPRGGPCVWGSFSSFVEVMSCRREVWSYRKGCLMWFAYVPAVSGSIAFEARFVPLDWVFLGAMGMILSQIL